MLVGSIMQRRYLYKESSDMLNDDDSRIIHLDNLKEYLQIISQLTATYLPFANNALSGNKAIVLIGEQNRDGLCSVLTSPCAGCHMEFQFSTSLRVQGMSGGHYWECNLAVVWGQMATGEGHAPLTESMAILGISSLTKKSFMSIEK